jgi:co-chaperonin GroES (HSP10)
MIKMAVICPSDMKILGNAVLILPDKMPARTAQGLIVPATAKDNTETGTVIDIGPACKDIKKGDRIYFPRKSCSVIEINGVTHFFTNEYKIFYYDKQ